MNNDKDFANDPIFKDLRKFAAKKTGPETMPAELFTAYRNAGVEKVRNKWVKRTVVGVIFAGIALPSLAAARVLPAPVANIVNQVTHAITAPVRVVASVITNNSNLTGTTNSPVLSPAPSSENNNDQEQKMGPAQNNQGDQNKEDQPIPNSTHKESANKNEKKSEPTEAPENNKPSAEPSDFAKGNEVEGEAGIAPKLPSTGASSAPSIGGSTEKSESGSGEKKEE